MAYTFLVKGDRNYHLLVNKTMQILYHRPDDVKKGRGCYFYKENKELSVGVGMRGWGWICKVFQILSPYACHVSH